MDRTIALLLRVAEPMTGLEARLRALEEHGEAR
jgi:hypothetical protein